MLKADELTIQSPQRQRYIIEFAFIGLAFMALFIHSIPAVPIAALFMLYAIVRCNLYENIYSFMVFYPYIAGYVFNTLGIPHVGGAMRYLGLMAMLVVVLMKKAKLNNIAKILSPLILLLLLFTISVFTTTGGEYAVVKLINTARYGIILLFAFAFLFSNNEKIDFTKLGFFYIVLSVFLLPMALVTNGISGPQSLLDIGFLRYQTHEDFFSSVGGDFHISYQNAGFLMLQSVGYFMVDYRRKNITKQLLVFSVVLYSLLLCGSRQAIVSFMLIIFVWALLINRSDQSLSKMRYLRGVVVVGLSIMVLYFMLQSLVFSEEGILNSVVEQGYVEGAGRGVWLTSGIEQFLSKPIWGVGYGRYMVFGAYGSYPHNMFVELLCETGLVGFAFAIIIAIKALKKNKRVFAPFLLLWLTYLMRSMASEDLSMNIAVFAFLFALYSIDKN